MNHGRFQGDLPERTFAFAAMVLDLVNQIPPGTKGWVLGKQLARSGTSIGANVCEADEALSEADFAHRCAIARKEAAETRYWLRLCYRTGLLSQDAIATAVQEADELVRILSAMLRKLQSRQGR